MTRIQPAEPVDWKRMFLTLRGEGYTLYDVSNFVGIPRMTLQGWMNGAEPRHQDGETVIRFWSEATQLPREALPVRPRAEFASRLAESRQ